MSNLGSWDVNVSFSLPQKIATAISSLSIMGAEYTPIAYLGSQVVNGTNHAVLAEQLLTNGKDTKNVVVLIFNERGMGCVLAGVDRVVESGMEDGGVKIGIEQKDHINKTAQELFDSVFSGFCGSIVSPIALLGTQVVRGIDYIFAAEVSPVLSNEGENNKKVVIVTINSLTQDINFADLLNSKVEFLSTKSKSASLSSPWVLFYKSVTAFFYKDHNVYVSYNDDEEPELKIWVKGNQEKAACLARFFPRVKKFGNVTLNISVVGDDGETPVPDVNIPDEMAIQKAFSQNDSVSSVRVIENIFGDRFTYVVFKPEVVQYNADNIADLFGVISTLNQDIAVNIFEDSDIFDKCFFCTDIIKN